MCIAWSGASLELAIESELDLEKERTGSEYFRSCSRLRYYETGCRHLSQNYLVGKAFKFEVEWARPARVATIASVFTCIYLHFTTSDLPQAIAPPYLLLFASRNLVYIILSA